MVMSLRRIVAVVAFAKLVPVMVAAARDRLNAITASTNHAEFAVKTLEGRCARADALRSAFTCSILCRRLHKIDYLDVRVMPMFR